MSYWLLYWLSCSSSVDSWLEWVKKMEVKGSYCVLWTLDHPHNSTYCWGICTDVGLGVFDTHDGIYCFPLNAYSNSITIILLLSQNLTGPPGLLSPSPLVWLIILHTVSFVLRPHYSPTCPFRPSVIFEFSVSLLSTFFLSSGRLWN